ncbi:chromo domain-containing protein [Trichonephila clavipes]|nr:chromo domain-containing protein [Trichonephila clavipes]
MPIKDLQGEDIKGTYYEAELQKVVDSGFYPVENVIKQRKRRGITEYFVKYLGYPEKFNDWVTDIQKV